MIHFGKDDKDDYIVAPFLIESHEEEDNLVKFIIALPVSGSEGEGIDETFPEEMKGLLRKSTPIYPDYENAYEIIFERYILYQTRNESFCSWDDCEIREGNAFIIFKKSRLLDYLSQITDCQQLSDGTFYPGKWNHYGIYCQNHIIDIVSCYEPTIRKINIKETQS